MGKNKTPEVAPPPPSFTDMLRAPKVRRYLVMSLSIEEQENYGRTRNIGARMLVYNLTPTRKFGQDVIMDVEDLLNQVEGEFGALDSTPPEA